MSETTTAPSIIEQPKVEISATPESLAMARLSADYGEDVKITAPVTETVTTPTTETPVTPEVTTPVVEPTAEEKLALINEAKELGLPETATKEEIATAKSAKEAESTWKIEDKVISDEEANDGTFKGLIMELGLGEIPADYSEEKGFETFQNLQKAHIESEVKKALETNAYDRFSDIPDTHRAEAQMLVELMKTGKTLAEINEPFTNLALFKSLSKEEVVREGLMNRYKNDEEVVDSKMQKITEDGSLDVEYRTAMLEVDNYEQRLLAQRKEQVEHYQNNQKQIQEQRRNQENLKLKVALDGVQEFLGKKLPAEIKTQLLNELVNEDYVSMKGSPEQKVKFFLWNKFGETAMKNFQDRALEKVVVQHKQDIHNVPIVQTGAGHRLEEQTNLTPAEQRLKQEYGT